MDRLSELQMLKLAEVYREYECLWDVTSESYKKRAIRERSYQEIADRLNIPGLTAKDVPKKVKNLRSSYYQEVKRIARSVQEDGCSEYTPKVSWFEIVDGILSTLKTKQDMLVSMDENSQTSGDFEACAQTDCIKVEELSNATDEDIEDTGSSHQFAVPIKKPRQKDGMQKAIARIDRIANRITKGYQERNPDEFDVFGKYIAVVLRTLPGELAVTAKLNLQKTLSDTQLSAIRQSYICEASTSNDHDEEQEVLSDLLPSTLSP